MAVLRNSALADVEPRENFDSHNQALVHPTRDLQVFLEQAVYTVANSRRGAAGLDVDIAGIQFRCFFKNQSLDTHNRRMFLGWRARFLSLDDRW